MGRLMMDGAERHRRSGTHPTLPELNAIKRLNPNNQTNKLEMTENNSSEVMIRS